MQLKHSCEGHTLAAVLRHLATLRPCHTAETLRNLPGCRAGSTLGSGSRGWRRSARRCQLARGRPCGSAPGTAPPGQGKRAGYWAGRWGWVGISQKVSMPKPRDGVHSQQAAGRGAHMPPACSAPCAATQKLSSPRHADHSWHIPHPPHDMLHGLGAEAEAAGGWFEIQRDGCSNRQSVHSGL